MTADDKTTAPPPGICHRKKYPFYRVTLPSRWRNVYWKNEHIIYLLAADRHLEGRQQLTA